MAGSIFTFLDDIASLMDDVAVASKVATQKTAAILGDDLAVTTEKATGYASSRELPVLWGISKGSLVNKVIIVPLILVLNVYAPIVIKALLVIGGIYLAYEGAEKIVEFLFHKKHKHHEDILADEVNPLNAEKKKVWAAIKTDFILSLEIVIIALSAVLDKSLSIQIITVSVVAIIATIGVYGFVAVLVRMDDLGFRLIRTSGSKGWLARVGRILVKGLPVIVKALSIIGTVALILVAGGIFIHYVDYFHGIMIGVPLIIRETIFGLGIGLITVVLIAFAKFVMKKFSTNKKER